MPRDYQLYLDDILEAIAKIQMYTKGLDLSQLKQDSKTCDAVTRNFSIIGEAIRNLPEGFRLKYPEIEWKKIIALRNILIHQYHGIDVEIVWDIIQNKIPELKINVLKIQNEGIL